MVNKDNDALVYPNQIGGTFAYPSGMPDYPNVVDHTRTYSITFTPDAATAVNYNPVTVTNVQFTVNKATPVLSNITSTAINYEQAITNSTISGTTANPLNAAFPANGSWSWRIGDFPSGFNTNRPEVYDSTARSGGTLYPIRFIPSDINNYNMIDGEAPLTVNPIDQTVTFTPLTTGNPTVRNESLRTDLADFEVSVTTGQIHLTAYTTAIYPSARQVRLQVSNVNMATLSDPIVEVVNTDDGVRSKTTYVLTLNPNITDFSYGILTITADQYDNNRPATPTQAGHRGNYNAATPVSYKLYIKREHTANLTSFVDIEKIYGDPMFTIEPALNSQLVDYSLTSSNNNILSLSQEATNLREATIVNTGTVTLTLSHPGYVDPNTSNKAYVAMTDSITVTITPTPLTVGLKNLEVYYGNSSPQFEYTFDGLVYNEDPTVVLRALTTANNTNYDFATMKNVKREAGGLGYYTVTPRNVQNTSVAFPNYILETYTSARLTVLPRTVTATIQDTEKLYGDVNPVFVISYSNDFVLGESIDTEGIIRPTVSYGTVERFSTVGDYTISLLGGSANNYNFNIDDTAILAVIPKPVNIAFPAIIKEYTGISVAPSLTAGDIVISGLEVEFPDDAIRPVNHNNVNAVKFAYSTDNINWTTDQPVSAAQYHVRVTYEAASYDNYATTSLVFERRITINPTNPRLTLAAVSTNYAATPISVAANALAVEYGIAPAGTLSYAYAGANGEYLTTPPRNAGTYSVRVTYVPASVDNYKSYTEYFTNILEINKVNVSLLLPVRETVYSTDGISPDKIASAQAEVYGKGDDQPETSGRFTYEYYIDGHWGNDRPFNAGRYHVRVTYTAHENENYLTTTVMFEERIIILAADIANNISLVTKTVDYTGSPVAANEALITRIPGGSEPIGRITYEYQLGSGNFEAEPFRNANRYNVRVRYTTVVGDNYKSTERFFEHAVVINRISPTISLPEYRYEFDGRVRSVTGASVTGIQGGSVPSGAVSYRYLVNGNWSSVGPRNASSTPYSVQVVYEPSADDNYSQEVKLFERGILISQAKPELFLATQPYDYTGSSITATGGRVMGKPNDDEGPIGVVTYQYYIDNIWTADYFPVNSGSYNVKMIFAAEDGTNYTSIEKIFSNVLIIRNIAPQFEVDKRSYDYDGEAHTIPEPKITNGNQEPLGTWTFEYYLGSNRWTSKAPSDAGSYDVRVRYNEAESDNYSSRTETVSDALVIIPLDIYVIPLSNQSKIYDGYPVAEGTILFNEIELITGNEWNGSLRAGNSATAGDYLITKGSLSAGNNYKLIVSESVVYTITPKEIQIKFSTIFPEYNGMPKTPEITVDESSLVLGDVVSIYTRYEGDNLNVGTFSATAIMSERNYTLPNPRSMQYSIVPARMTENIFLSYSIPYNKESHPITLSAIASGATVVYDSPTEYTSRGVYTVKATVSKPNYHDDILSATLTITRGTHLHNLIVFPPENALYYGDALPKITSSVSEGQISLDAGQLLLTGTHDYAWTFVPADTENFDTLHGSIKLTVNKSKSIVELQGALTQYLDAPQSINAVITNKDGQLLSNNPNVFFTSAEGEVFEYLPTKSGRYTLNIVYAGDENFDSASYTTVLVIKEKTNLIWLWGAISGVVLLVVASALYFKHRSKSRIG